MTARDLQAAAKVFWNLNTIKFLENYFYYVAEHKEKPCKTIGVTMLGC